MSETTSDTTDGTSGATTGEAAEGAPLDAAAGRRVAASTVALIATADPEGERHVTVLAGARCFLRVLDRHRFAWPDEGDPADATDHPVEAYRDDLAASSRVTVVAVAPGSGGSRSALRVHGRAEVVRADVLRAEHPDLPANPVPGQYTDVWVVVDVDKAHPLDGDDVPAIGALDGAAAYPAPSAPSRKGPPTRKQQPSPPAPPASGPAAAGAAGATNSPANPSGGGRRFGLPVVAALLALVVLLVVALVATALSGPSGSPGAPGTPGGDTTAAGAPAGPVVVRGRVLEVPDPNTVVVDVAGTPTRYGVVGIGTPPPPCAAGDALDFARRTLQGQTATMVPDPTLPATPQPRAYVVLETQLSYTDAAILGGWALPTGDAEYRPVFDRELTEARDGGRGMWGPPCVP